VYNGQELLLIVVILINYGSPEGTWCDNLIIRPDELLIRPDELLIRPDELLIRPDGLLIRPDELLIRPDGLIIRPDELLNCHTMSLRGFRNKQINVSLLSTNIVLL